MPEATKFLLLENNEIDKEQWDKCVLSSPQSLIYAHSFYLDFMAPGWKALVNESYDWVLPLTHKKKFGIAYLYQPPFTQQLGVFAKENVAVPYKEIQERLQNQFKFWEIFWNYATKTDQLLEEVKHAPATNYTLPLHASYNEIAERYHQHLRRNLKRSTKYKLHYHVSRDIEKAIFFFAENYAERIPHVTAKDFQNLIQLCSEAQQKNMFLRRDVVDDEGNLLAAALIFQDKSRLYNIINITTEAGRSFSANHFLFDSLIQEFAGTGYLLDFEGSDIIGVREFYKYFGAINEPYYFIRYNGLPALLRLIKK